MALFNLSLPVIGQSGATEDQKVRDNFSVLQTGLNGGLDAANFASTATIPAVGAFAAYRSAAATMAAGTNITFEAEEFDVSSWYDVTTGRYTPRVAGYYRLSWLVHAGAGIGAGNLWLSWLFKNGALHRVGSRIEQAGTNSLASPGTAVVQANGTSDYFQVYVNFTGAGPFPLLVGPTNTYFCGELIGR